LIKKENSTLSKVTKIISTDSNYKDCAALDILTPLRTELLYEPEAFEPLATNLVQFIDPNRGMRNHALIIGSRGSGKTAIVDYLLTELKDNHNFDFERIYLNCRHLDNSYQIMRGILGETKKLPKYDIYGAFMKKLTQIKKKVIIVLDEVDLITDDTIFYSFTRDQDLRHVLLIMITKTPHFWDNLTADVKSSLSKEEFFFDSYDYNGIREILTKRAKIGLKSFDSLILLNIALATQNKAYGDIRVGIRVLDRIFRNPNYPQSQLNKQGRKEVPKKVMKEIEEMTEEEYFRLKEGVIRKLNETHLLILYFMLKTKRSNKAFKEFQKQAFTTVSKSNFLKQVNELRHLDLFYTLHHRHGRSTILDCTETIGEKNVKLVEELIKSKMLLKEDEN